MPLVLLAQPVGAPTSAGSPLRLRFTTGSEAVPTPKPNASTAGRASARRPTARAVDARLTHPRSDPSRRAAPEDLLGRALAAGKLQIEELVGAGGVGAVYRARHRELRIPVAVKVLLASFQSDDDFCARFHAEALAASALAHPNLTRVYDFGQEPDGLLYLAMEFLDGDDLRTVLRDELVVGATRAVQIMLQVCAGLGHAHARGIVHRDVKPENLVLVAGTDDDDGREKEHVKVCDFGIAQAGAASEGLAGTPDYMSPEQWRGASLDARSDVYACGVVLYELVTGCVPFVALDAAEAFRQHVQASPTPPSRRCVDLDPRVERVILRALAKDPAARQQSMRELRAELKAAIDVVPPASVERPRAPHDAPSSSRSVVPEWLEDRRASYSAFLAGSAREPSAAAATVIARDPAGFVARLAATMNPSAFAAIAEPLEGAIRVLAAGGDARSLARLAAALDGAIQASDLDARESTLAPAMTLLSDPTFLAPLARLALEPGSVVSSATELVVRAGVAGACALYAARVRTSAVHARLQFVIALRAIGPTAAPVLRAGLEHIEGRLGAAGAIDVAIDLLAAAPAAADDATGNVIARYAACGRRRLVVEAVPALARVWRGRARPFLAALLGDADDRVRCTAARAIAEVGGVDLDVVRRLRRVVESSRTTAAERCVAAAALGYATGEARAEAASILSAAFEAVVGAPDASEEVAVAIARALVTTGGPHGRARVERARRSTPNLRVALGAVFESRGGV